MTEEETSRDWRTIEHVLNNASNLASEPFYTQIEAAKNALFRLGSAAMELAEKGGA